MAFEKLDQFLNRGFCIARGSLVWCLKSHYLEILKLNCLHLKKVLILGTSIPTPPPPSRTPTTLQAEIGLYSDQYLS